MVRVKIMLRPVLSWCGPRSHFCYCQKVAGLLIWFVLSDERTGLSFTISAGSRQRSHSLVLVPRTRDTILLPHIRDFPDLEDLVPVFVLPRNRVAQFYPQALGSLFVASYDSQGCGGGIRTRIHTGTD
jgi:hypothetical protein